MTASAHQPELVVQTGHSATVFSAAFSPDGQIVASGGGDCIVKLWDVRTGKKIRSFRRHSGTVLSLAISADGKILASSGNDGTIRLWDVSTKKELRTLIGHEGRSFLAFSPDGNSLVSGGLLGTIIWNVRTGEKLHTFTEVSTSVAFSPDSHLIASASYPDCIIKIWDVSTGKALHTLTGHSDQITELAFSLNGKILRRDYLVSQIHTYQWLISAYVRAGDFAKAFEIIELSRAKLLAERLVGSDEVSIPSLEHIQRTLPDDTAVLIYANTNQQDTVISANNGKLPIIGHRLCIMAGSR